MNWDNVRRAPNTMLFDVWRVSRLVHGLLDDAIADSGLTAEEFALFSILSSSESVTPSKLAEWLAVAPTTVSTYIKRLKEKGQVEYTVNPADRRSTLLRLTPDGERAYRAARELFIPVLREVLNGLTLPEEDVRRSLHDIENAVLSTRPRGECKSFQS
jgi:DNA-binding MarR family transcriptional regulator